MLANEGQLERRQELERKLEADTDELTKLQDGLAKTNLLTEKMVDKIVDCMEVTSKQEKFISKGPTKDEDIGIYVDVVTKMKEALAFLDSLHYKAVGSSVTDLKVLLSKAQFHFDLMFRKTLTQHSTPIDAQLYLDPDVPMPTIPDQILNDLTRLAQQLAALDRVIGDRSSDMLEHVKTYADVRSSYLIKSLSSLSTVLITLDSKKLSNYVKGSSTFIPYSKSFLKMIKTEKDIIGKLILKPQALACFQKTIQTAADSLIEVGDAIVARVKRGVQKKEYTELYMLIDIVANLSASVKEYEGIIAYSGAKGTEITELIAHAKTTIMFFFKDFSNDIKEENPKASLPTDGTVHEIASVTLNVIRRLMDYVESIDQMLSEGWGAGLSAQSFKTLVVELLESLYVNLDLKAKAYKKPTLSTIFLLNNYHYVFKQMKALNITSLVGSRLEDKYETGYMKQQEIYRDSGGIKQSLTKAQRETIKDKFKNFNAEFDSMYNTQKAYTIPDPELKAQTINDIKTVLLPLYTRFQDRYTQIEFSKNPSKYIKYEKVSLEAALDKFFDGSV
ncbi:Exocyst complex component 7 [Blyttiomyces sp. JEL0837]|nr:Exocyst complex component 7 [Blyttiomyces sp. JEL0837]